MWDQWIPIMIWLMLEIRWIQMAAIWLLGFRSK
ncbi:uncharacterized protein NMK_3329 [Novimethylophilus kurashikiensis]|uniref:Uncharacterized protein n=1 Tax=Novimethylophilus kurashikiensis TaxID=1825523 RepID=A0A2R5FE66_9PROT|nr:uncharacterized protein NMK_3329 [Novimethylophilus kurashikiensis]